MIWLKLKARATRRDIYNRLSQNGPRLFLETLESRLTPTVVLTVDATHSFVNQLAAAQPGATLQINPGAVLGTLGTNGASTAAANAGDTTLDVDAAFAPGQIITISDSGDTTESDLIDAVSGPTGGVYTLTLHTPLADSHQDGSMVVATPGTLGIGKGITIQGDPKDAPSSLLSGVVLDYFTQNGSPVPDALTHLALTAVDGTTSSNLSITGDTFTIASGSSDAVNVIAGGALTLGTDTFSVGSSANLASVVVGQTGSGAINFDNDTVSASNLGGDAIALTSTSGPISVSSVNLKVSGTIGGDGLDLVTNGEAAVAGINTFNLKGALTGSPLYVQSGAAASVSEVTAVLSGNAGDGIEINSRGDLSASNLNIAVGGSVLGTYGQGAAIDLFAMGDITASDLTASVQQTANNGFSIVAAGDVTLGGKDKVSVTGAVADDGAYVSSTSDNTSITGPVKVQLLSTAVNGLYVNTPNGTVVDTGAVEVSVAGNVSYNGVSLISGGNLSLAAPVNVQLLSTAGNGLYVNTSNGTVVDTGAVEVSVAGNVSYNGVSLISGGNLSLVAPVNVQLLSTAGNGLYVNTPNGTVVDTGAVEVSVAGNVSYNGVSLISGGNLSLGASLTLTAGAACGYGGVELDSEKGTASNTSAITISIAGQVGSSGSALYVTSGNGGTVGDVTITLNNSSEGYGAFLNGNAGNLAVNKLTLSVTGAVADYGLYLTAENITTNNVKVNLSSTAEDGIYVSAIGDLAMTNTTDSVGGAITDAGAYLSAGSAGTISSLKVTLAQTAAFAVEIPIDNGDLAVSGLSVHEAGAASANGVFLYSIYGNVTFADSTIALNGGVSPESDDAVEVMSSHGNVAIDKDTITVTGATAAGLTATAQGSLEVMNTSVTTSGGTAVLLTDNSGNPQTIENDTFSTGGTGTGLAFTGGASVVALVQGNIFENNLVGVAITGDGANAGDIDLGGGWLGSKGKNNFSGFTGTSGHYAIALNDTDATSTVYALDNKFTVANPNAAVQDAANNGGTGIIDV